MKKFFKKLLIKSTAILCSAMLLFMSPYAGYLGASNMEYVQATELVAGYYAGEIAIEWLLAFLASLGLGAAVYDNRDAIEDAFTDYLQTQESYGEQYGSMQEPCIQVYNSNTNTATDLSWQDVLEGLHEFHDEAVDNLTGLYVKYCPALLLSFEDFVNDVIYGEIEIPELSIALMDDTFSDYESIWNVDGTYNFYGFYSWFANPTFVGHEVFYQRIYMGTVKSKPFAYVNENGDQYRLCVLRSLNSSSWYSEQSYSGTTYMDGVFSANHSTKFIYCDSTQYGFGVNCPVFSSLDAAKDAFISDDFSDALNFIDKTMESVIDLTDIPDLAPDIPPFTKSWRQGELERLLNSPDATGIGSYDRGVSVDNWIDHLPWLSLDSLREYYRSLDGIYRQMLDDIINGTYDSAKGIPGTYSEAWEQTISEAWESIVEQSETVPDEGEKDKPTDEDEDEKDDPEKGGGGNGDSNNDREEPPEGGRFTEEEIQEILKEMKGDGFKNNPIRQAYEEEVRALKGLGEALLASGKSLEEVARTLWQARRDLGIQYKEMTPELLREYIYEINLERYNDKLGPTFEYYTEVLKRSFEEIIDSASRPNIDIDKLLEGFEEWLRRQ